MKSDSIYICDFYLKVRNFYLKSYLKVRFHLLKVRNCMKIITDEGFPGGSDSKESSYSVGDLCSIPGLGRSPGEGHGNPLQYCHLENFHEHRSLAGNSPWGCKELDTTVTKHNKR